MKIRYLLAGAFALIATEAHAQPCKVDKAYEPFIGDMRSYVNDVVADNKKGVSMKPVLLHDLEVLKSGKPQHEVEDISDLETAIKKHDGKVISMTPVWNEVANVSEYFVRGNCK